VKANAEARRVAVPLEAGFGPENPPCPACGEPLFGWTRGPGGVPVRRCESCAMAVIGEPGDAGDALARLDEQRLGGDAPRFRIANRASFAASLGGGGWAAIDRCNRYLFSAEAVRRLAATRGQQVDGVRWRPLASLLVTWGTLLNSFTFGHNVALGALGRAAATQARRPWQRGIDRFVSVLATPVVMLAALLLEAVAGISGRGAVLELTLSPR